MDEFDGVRVREWLIGLHFRLVASHLRDVPRRESFWMEHSELEGWQTLQQHILADVGELGVRQDLPFELPILEDSLLKEFGEPGPPDE